MHAIVALLGLAGARYQKIFWPIVLVASTIVAHYSWRLEGLQLHGWSVVLGNPAFFAHFLNFFSMGACFAIFSDKIPLNGKLAAVAGLLLLPMLFKESLHREAVLVFFADILFWFAFSELVVLDNFKNISGLSYGIHLYGWPIQKLLDYYFPTANVWLLVVVAWVLCCLAGYASWHLVEKYFIQRKHKPVLA
jgi:hypothetical protein